MKNKFACEDTKSLNMNIEEFREFCLSLPGTTEDIKWENNLVFSVGGKIFALADLSTPLRVSFKVPEATFDELTERYGIIQAPYFARRKWVMVNEPESLWSDEWKHLLKQSYDLVMDKLPLKIRRNL